MVQFSLNGVREFVRKLYDSSVGAFQEEKRSVVGIDIGSSAVKVVQLRRKGGRAVLETYGELSLGPYADLTIGQATKLPEKKVAEALSDLLREANVTTDSVGISIPLSASLITIMELPAVSEGRLKEMVPIEARRYIPVPISEVTIDWMAIPEDTLSVSPQIKSKEARQKESIGGRSRVKVLLAAIHNDVIASYQRIARQAQLNTSFFEIEVFSLARALLRRGRKAVLVIDLGAATTKLSIVEGGIAVNTHIINRGSQNITQALSKSLGISLLKAEEMKREFGLSIPNQDVLARTIASGDQGVAESHNNTTRAVVEGIFAEVQQMVSQYEKKHHKTVSKFILSGGGSLLRDIFSLARENFEAEIEYADPFSKTESPAFLEATLKEVGPNFSVAIGIALRKLQELE